MGNMLKISAIGLSLLAGCEVRVEPELSLSQKIVEMNQSVRCYSNSLCAAEVIISDAINSRYFSANKQKDALKLLKDAKTNCDRYNTLSASCPEHIDGLIFQRDKLTQLELLSQNVEGFDGNKPKIQEYFSGRYAGFKAEAIESGSELAAEAAAEISAQIISVMLSGD